ncbi:DUF350 domain-containing protein [Chondrinema litorale]|uniref:DUF350 domain-containing protein n=1 Tax=Chondrinema litorale TaxID=2994555 RepID=UPI00254292FE|nr:DUF350 domain-containing protein [Chondrinema litorale]UZR96051.1 DUF350 domain-containing protein [Chondrinema litorale]
MEFLSFIPEEILSSVSLLIAYVLIFLISKWLKDLLTPFSINAQLTSEDNLAVAISMVGYFIGITVIYLGAVDGPGNGLLEDLLAVGGYSLGGIILLNISRIINDKLILYKFSTIKEIIEDKNPGTGVVQAASYIASGLVIAGAIHGEGGGILSALIFFLVGQVVLIVFALIYEKITPYSVHDEIEKDNTAAGLGFSGGIVAIGIIILKAISGDMESYADHFSTLAFDIALIIVLMVFVRFFFDKFIIPEADLSKEISEDKNIGAGLLEGFISISFACVLYFVL